MAARNLVWDLTLHGDLEAKSNALPNCLRYVIERDRRSQWSPRYILTSGGVVLKETGSLREAMDYANRERRGEVER